MSSKLINTSIHLLILAGRILLVTCNCTIAIGDRQQLLKLCDQVVNQELTPDDIIKCNERTLECEVDSTTDVDDSPIKKKPKITPAKVSKKANSAVKKMLIESKMLSAKKRAREIFARTTTGSDEEDVSEIDKLKMQIQELIELIDSPSKRPRSRPSNK